MFEEYTASNASAIRTCAIEQRLELLVLMGDRVIAPAYADNEFDDPR
jgi:hypothetical protein